MSPELLSELFNKHHKVLVRFADKILGDGLFVTGEDVVSDVFIEVYQTKFSHYENIRSILFYRVRYKCFEYLRKHIGRKKINATFKVDEISNEYADAMAIKYDLLADLSAKYQSLHPQRKRVFEFLYLQGSDIRETAIEMNLSEHTVRSVKKFLVKLFGIFPRKVYVTYKSSTDIQLSKKYRA